MVQEQPEVQRHTEDDLVRTMPRNNSLDSDDDDASLAESPVTDSLRHRSHTASYGDLHSPQLAGHTSSNGSPDNKGLQAPTNGMLDQPDPPVPSLASRMLSPFAAFSLQTLSRSRSSVPSEHDVVI